VMTHRSGVVMIDATKAPADIVQEVLASPHTRLPMFEGEPDNVIGVIHAKDLLRAVQRAEGKVDTLDIREIASAPWFIPESTSLLDQLRAFRQRREHFAVVVDEYGSLMGIVTLEDIIEEIVGDISDEHDAAVAGIRPAGVNAWIVNGDVTIRDLNRELGWELPDEHAATVAGLVMHEARRIPEIRQVFAFHGIRFEILRRRNHRITSIRVSPLEPGDETSASEGNGG
jgi:Mg2+/Co2+ transporter CorB